MRYIERKFNINLKQNNVAIDNELNFAKILIARTNFI